MEYVDVERYCGSYATQKPRSQRRAISQLCSGGKGQAAFQSEAVKEKAFEHGKKCCSHTLYENKEQRHFEPPLLFLSVAGMTRLPPDRPAVMTVVHHVLSAAAVSSAHFPLTHRVLDRGHGGEINNASESTAQNVKGWGRWSALLPPPAELGADREGLQISEVSTQTVLSQSFAGPSPETDKETPQPFILKLA
ncbi:hypothetical protein NQZ68_032714 [Dissostichus eleginoides]|nr:hypothetical protein NQZ68_032714 [Dissostichus eleginoides]